MPKATMGADLLQPLKIIAELGVDTVGKNLGVLAVDNVLLPVQEPSRDLELRRVLDNGNQPLELIRVEITGAECVFMCVRNAQNQIESRRTAC